MVMNKVASSFATAIVVFGTLMGSAQAQEGVKIEGASFEVAHNKRTRQYQLRGSAQVVNYSYSDESPVAVKIGLVKKRRLGPGRVEGYTIGSSEAFTLYARTRIRNIPLAGAGVLPPGTFYPVALVVRPYTNEILAITTPNRRLSVALNNVAGTQRRVTRALHGIKAAPSAELRSWVSK